eukprot:gene27082-35796_t
MEPTGNDSLQTEYKLPKKLTAPSSSHFQRALSDMSSSSISYLRCGRIHSTLPLPKSSSNLASDDSSISIVSNSHRRRSFSLGSQLSTSDIYQDMQKISQPIPCSRSVTYPTHTAINSSTNSCTTNLNRRQPVRLRSSSLSTFEKSKSTTSCSSSITSSNNSNSNSNSNVVRKPSKSMISHQLLLRETVRAALSESFPDKCFDSSDPSLQQFTFLTVQDVMMKVNSYFAEVTVTQPQFLGRLWSSIEEAVNLRRCEVFSYSPDVTDESNFVNVWAFHYFFFNKDTNVLVYFNCAATSKLRKNELDYISEDEDEYNDYLSEGEMDVDSAEESNEALQMRRRMQLDTLDEDDSADEIPQW